MLANVIQLKPDFKVSHIKYRAYLNDLLVVRDRIISLPRDYRGRKFESTDIPSTIVSIVSNRPTGWTVNDVCKFTTIPASSYYRWNSMYKAGILQNGMTVRFR